MKKSIILSTIISLFALQNYAQSDSSNLVKRSNKVESNSVTSANKLFARNLYMQAIPKYESALKKDSSNVNVLQNLGECYRLTNNNKGQLICYGKLISLGKGDDIHNLYYAQALMGVERYDEAKKYFEEFKGDSRGQDFANAINTLQKFSKNADAYAIDTVSFNSTYDDFSAVTFLDNKVVFTSTRTKGAWISRHHGWTDRNYCQMYSTKKGAGGKYEKPVVFLDNFSSKFNDGPFCSSKDGQTIFFTRNTTSKKEKSVDGTQKLKIFQAVIIKGDPQSLMEMKFNSTEYNCAHPALSADGNTLYFSSDMGGGQGGMDIWYCKKDAGGVWGTPINMGDKVNTKGTEIFPSITEDNLLYFASNGHPGLGGLDIFETKIKNDISSKVYNMGKPVNSEHDDFAYNLNSDGKKGFFSSNRKTGGMNDDIYSLDVLRKVVRGKIVNFIVKDKNTQEIVPLAKIKMNADSFITNDKGELQTVIEEDIEYHLGVSKEKYFGIEDFMSTKTAPEQDEFSKIIELERNPNLTLLACIYDAKTGVGIPDVKITIKDVLVDNNFELVKTQKNGEYKKSLTNNKVGDKLHYVITIEKEGYLTKTLNFSYDITKEGEIQLNELLALTIGKVELGYDLSKMIDVKPIYFDLGKSDIRKDGAIELEKVITVLKQYPAMVIELGAHTDCRGKASANLKLSAARAKAATAYIVKQGIDKNRISGKGYGESKLINSCGCEGTVKSTCSEEEHAINRRIEFIIVNIKK